MLYNLILSSKYVAKHHFLKDVLIAETMLAVSQGDDQDRSLALPSAAVTTGLFADLQCL